MRKTTLQEDLEAIDMNVLWTSCNWEDSIFDATKIKKLWTALKEAKGTSTLLEVYKEMLRVQMLRHAFLFRQIDTTLYGNASQRWTQFLKTRIAKVDPHFIIEGDTEHKYREIEEQLVALHELFCKYWEEIEMMQWVNIHRDNTQKTKHGAGKRITSAIFTGGYPYKGDINQGVNIGDWFMRGLTKIEGELHQYQALEGEQKNTEFLASIISQFNKICSTITHLNTDDWDRELIRKCVAQIRKIHGLITILDRNNLHTNLAELISS